MEIPSRVKERFDGLKKEYDHIYLRNLSGRFYVYRITSTKAAGPKKGNVSSEYIGRITEEGAFVKRGMSEGEKTLEVAKAVIEERGGKVIMPEVKVYDEDQKEVEESKLLSPSEEERKILTILSMNGRARMKSIGKVLGITAQATTRKVRELEKRHKLEYTVEIDPIKLGYLEYLVFIRFEGEKPTTAELLEAFDKLPIVQFCALLKGEYDVMLYVLVDVDDVRPTLEGLRFNTLTKFNAIWYINSVTTFYGFMPIRDLFFDLLKNRIWHRKRGIREVPQYALFQRDYKSLRALNNTGKKKFNEIDKENGLPNGSSRYAYYGLLGKGILKRITIKERNLPIAYDALLQFKLVNVNTYQTTRNNYRLDVVKPSDAPYNEYSVIFDLYNPDGFLAVVPVSNGDSIDAKADGLKAVLKGVKLDTVVIVGVLIGEICHRRFDNAYSVQYESLVQQKTIEQEERIQYDKL
ncbi:MAG TPA: hypothetical protein VND15_04300 [Candidatus Acidoferrales bacterium]|nr:hypothetical protein [Candidatus Acidoferrales bacterium]